MNSKKIAIVIPDLGGGGAEKVALALANGLSVENDVRLILFKKEGVFLDYLSKDVELVVLKKDHRNLKQIFSLLRLIRKNLLDRDIFIAGFQLFTEFYVLLASIDLAIKRVSISQIDVRRILQIKGYPILPFKIIGKILYSFFDLCICSSIGVKNALIETFTISRKKVKHIYNPFFDLQTSKKKVEVDYEKPIFITLARLNYQKRLDIMIKAFNIFRKKTGKGTLMVLGEGELKENLIDITKRLKISDNIKFLGFRKNITGYLKKADIFLLSSDFEGFGNVLVEAMASGLPIISTDCPSGPGEILKKGEYGILVPVRNPHIMAENMIELYSNKEKLYRYKQLSSKRAKDFSLEKILKEYKDVIDRL